ncbi:MAG: hypothetical protein KFH87_14080 [Bacteroidetes bacterium]|nr:hypothetical protein [Bacteroidota bacterium]
MRNPVRIHETNTVQFNLPALQSVGIASGSMAIRSVSGLHLSSCGGATSTRVYHHEGEQ